MIDAPEIIEFSATTSLRDILAATPKPARKTMVTAWRRPVIFLGLFLFGALGGVLFGADDKVAALKEVVTTKIGLQIVAAIALIGSMSWLAGRGWRWAAKALMRRVYVDARRSHPDVDRSDKTLAMRRLYRFDESGMTTTSSADEIWEGWPRINGLDETADLLIVRIGNGAAAYPIPKAELSAEIQERLTGYVAARSNSKWPF